MMHLLHKRFMENYQCLYAHGEVFVSESERRMEETVVGSTSSAATCMKRQMTTLILTEIWLWMQ
jgi:hypothetical protein